MENVNQVISDSVVWADVLVSRSMGGLNIWIKVHPNIEEFMKNSSEGVKNTLSSHGRSWRSTAEGVDIEVYGRPYGLADNQEEKSYLLDALCSYMSMGSVVNLSFLRMVGISSEAGISFQVTGYPFSIDYTRMVSKMIVNGIRSFVNDFISPITISMKLVSREFR